MEKMNTEFDTTKMRVMIESVSASGSAFGTTEGGDTVFLNKRLVDRVDLDMGDVVEAYVIPNFEDKRQSIPWRAVRVSPNKESVDTPVPAIPVPAIPVTGGKARSSSVIDAEILAYLGEEEVAYWTTADLAGAVDADTVTVANSCTRLFSRGLIAKADVHARPDQKRASFCLWALDTGSFL